MTRVIIDATAPDRIISELQRRGWGTVESSAGWVVVTLPRNLSFRMENGKQLWRKLMQGRRPRQGELPYILAAPVDGEQRQYQRRIERRNWLVVVEHETPNEAGEVQP